MIFPGKRMKRKVKGFNLVELLLVVTIIGILAAIALPAYQQYVLESRRSDAYTALAIASAEQERINIYDNRYTADINAIGGNASPEGHYSITLVATDSTFTLTATALSSSPQFQDLGCRSLSLDHLGRKTGLDSNGVVATDCW